MLKAERGPDMQGRQPIIKQIKQLQLGAAGGERGKNFGDEKTFWWDLVGFTLIWCDLV
jgi:hypothetical protein